MKNKTIADLRGQRQLSREQMKSVAAGKFPQPPDCSGCLCTTGWAYESGGSCFCGGSGVALPCGS